MGATTMKASSFVLVPGLSLSVALIATIAIAAAKEPELPRVPTLNGPEFKTLLTSSDDQIVVGVVQKGQCGQPCEMLEVFMQQLQAKMAGFLRHVSWTCAQPST